MLNLSLTCCRALIDEVDATEKTCWIGGMGTAGADPQNIIPDTEFIGPLAGTRANAGTPSFTAELHSSVVSDIDLCGRVDADNEDNLIFEASNVAAYQFMCEYCG